MEGRVRRLGCDASHNRVIPRGTKKVGGKVGPQGEGEGEEGRRVHSPRARVVGSRREVSHGTPARRLFDASDASLAQGRSVSVCVHTPEYACDGEFRVSKSCHVIIICVQFWFPSSRNYVAPLYLRMSLGVFRSMCVPPRLSNTKFIVKRSTIFSHGASRKRCSFCNAKCNAKKKRGQSSKVVCGRIWPNVAECGRI